MPNYTTPWDETVPAGTEDISQGDDRIIEEKSEIRERLATQHSDITGTAGDALLTHLAGKCTVLFVGTTAEIAAVTGILGATAIQNTLFYDTDLLCFKGYDGTNFNTLLFDWDSIFPTDTGVHTHISDAQGGALSLPTFLPTPTNLLSWTAYTAWTDIDVTTLTTPAVAKSVILAIDLQGNGAAGGLTQLSCKATAYLRPKGYVGSDATLPRVGILAAKYANVAPHGRGSGTILVAVDANQILQVKLVDEGNGTSFTTLDFKVDLVGYFV
jgi:hypothetical protein